MASTRPTEEKGALANQDAQTLVNLLMQELRKLQLHAALQNRIRASGHALTHTGVRWHLGYGDAELAAIRNSISP